MNDVGYFFFFFFKDNKVDDTVSGVSMFHLQVVSERRNWSQTAWIHSVVLVERLEVIYKMT